MSAAWYVETGGKRSGPFTSSELKELAATGRLGAQDLVFKEGMNPIPAARVKGLIPGGSGESVANVASEPPARGEAVQPRSGVLRSPPPVPAGTSDAEGRGPLKQVSGLSARAKVLAVVGVAVIGFCLFSAVVGVIMNLAGVKPGKSSAAKTKDQNKGAALVEVPQGEKESPKTDDLAKVDYSFDFSKVDYSPPAGKAQTTRSAQVKEVPQNGDKDERNRWEKAEGYADTDGKFVQNGKRTLWFDQGETEKYTEQQWLRGKLHGPAKRWNRKGQMIFDGTYVDGALHGVLTKWYNNGQKSFQGHWLKGKVHGVLTKWAEDGTKDLEEVYADDRLNGAKRTWWPNGKPQEETDYLNDEKHGKHAAWDREGKLTAQGQFDKGKPTGAWRFGFRPRGGGELYYIDTQAGPWKGGTKAEFLCRLAGAVKGSHFPREGYCRCYVSHSWFIDTFGQPDQNRGYVGSGTWQRVWSYRCSDGVLSFHLATDGKTINLETGT